MTSADRLTQVLDKWLTSLELHTQYAQLSDLAYSCVQPWPKHDRPTRWVVQIAREKLLQLKQHCDTRRAAGDEQFAESLELMLTLANLVGLQHIQRFIPLADPARANPIPSEQPANTPDFAALVRPAEDDAEGEPTRELPQLEAPASAVQNKAAAARQARQAMQRNSNPSAIHAAAGARPAATKISTASSGAAVANAQPHPPKAVAYAANVLAASAQANTRPIVAGTLKQSTTAAATAIPGLKSTATRDVPQRRTTANIGANASSAKPSSSPGMSTARAQTSIATAATPTVKPSLGVLNTESAAAPSHTKPVTASTRAESANSPPDTEGAISDTQEMPRPVNPPTRIPARNAATEAAPAAEPEALTPAEHIVITDAIRLLKWGRPWHELAELVSRIADRPGITQVRRILRTHRADIEARADVE